MTPAAEVYPTYDPALDPGGWGPGGGLITPAAEVYPAYDPALDPGGWGLGGGLITPAAEVYPAYDPALDPGGWGLGGGLIAHDAEVYSDCDMSLAYGAGGSRVTMVYALGCEALQHVERVAQREDVEIPMMCGRWDAGVAPRSRGQPKCRLGQRCIPPTCRSIHGAPLGRRQPGA